MAQRKQDYPETRFAAIMQAAGEIRYVDRHLRRDVCRSQAEMIPKCDETLQ
jgi:hypothetical protein